MRYIPQEAYCEKDKYHLHTFYRIAEYDEAISERCRQCGKRVIYNKKDGRIDNKLYGKYHYRDILQPSGEMEELFYEIYGKEGIKRSQEYYKNKINKNRMANDITDMVREERKSWKQKHYSMK